MRTAKTKTEVEAVEKPKKKKQKLILYRADSEKQKIHPLLNRKVRDTVKMESDLPLVLALKSHGAVTKKCKVHLKRSQRFENITGHETDMFQWLKDTFGYDICPIVDHEEATPDKALYSFDGKVCSFGYILLIANDKRREQGLLPYLVNWLFD